MNLIINILSVYNHDFLDSFNLCCRSHILMVLSSCNIIKKFIRFKVHLMFVFWLLQLFLIISFHSFYFNEVKFILTSCNLQDLYKSFLSIYFYFLICLLKSQQSNLSFVHFQTFLLVLFALMMNLLSMYLYLNTCFVFYK